MARLRTNGSCNVLRRLRKIWINPESKKVGEINSELSISKFLNVPLVFFEPEDAKSNKDGRIYSEFAFSEFNDPSVFFEPDGTNFKKDDEIDLEFTFSDFYKFMEQKWFRQPEVSFSAGTVPRSIGLQPRSQSFPPSLQSPTITSVLEQNDVEAVLTDPTSNTDFQESSGSYHLEWVFIISNLVLEILLVGLDQIARPQKPEYAFTALALSTIAISVSLFELYLKARRQGLVGF